jgi:LysR family transcriptional activator of nhaA
MLNYKHLYYFREVATTGSISRASDSLHLTPQTISGQLGLLEEALGVELLQKSGRNLELTEAGRVALGYADEIFQIGARLEEAMRHYPKGGVQTFRVGVSDVVPKSIAYRLLAPAMQLPQAAIRIVCTEGKLTDLLAELAVHRMELVIADSPMPNNMNVRCFNHELGSSSISFFAMPVMQAKLKGEFPQCLNDAELLIPCDGTAVRSKLRQWFQKNDLHPRIVGEFDDSALMKAFGQAGTGIFVAPTALEANMRSEGFGLLGRADDINEQFFAISVERRITHPAVKAITESAQGWLQKGR